MITIEEFDSFVQHDVVFDQKLLFYIEDGKEYFIKNLGHLHSNYGKTLKMECGERYNNKIYNFCKSFNYFGPVTCHIYRAYSNSDSFKLHTDPDDVLLKMLEGQKIFEIDGKETILKQGEEIFIPANTPHRAINTNDSLMLSIGFEKFLIDKV